MIRQLFFTTLLTLLLTGCPNGSFRVNTGSRFVSSDGYSFNYEGLTASRKQKGLIGDGAAEIHIDHRFGPVTVEAGQAPYGWTWETKTWAAKRERAETFAKSEMGIEVKEGDGVLRFRLLLPEPTEELKGVKSTLKLRVPQGVALEIRNRHGALTLHGLEGAIDARTSFGVLDAEDIAGGKLANRHGAVNARSVEGELSIETEYGAVEVKTVQGDLTIRNVHGKVVAVSVSGKADIQTSFAKLDVRNVEGGSVLRNRHGEIYARDLGGKVDLETEFGKADLSTRLATEVECKNRHGAVQMTLGGAQLTRVAGKTRFGDLRLELPAKFPGRFSVKNTFGTLVVPKTVEVEKDGFNEFHANWEEPNPQLVVELENEHGDLWVQRVGG